MDVVGMAIPGTHLRHPRSIIWALHATEFFFYRSIHEDALNLRLLGRSSDEGHMGRLQSLSSTFFPSSATTLFPKIFSRSSLLKTRSGIGINQISTSSPIWWLLCPNGSGPPRGCAMSPLKIPFHPVSAA